MASPHTGVLVGFEGEIEACVAHRAACTKTLRLLDRNNRAAGRSDGEEQLRISVSAERVITPLIFGR